MTASSADLVPAWGVEQSVSPPKAVILAISTLALGDF